MLFVDDRVGSADLAAPLTKAGVPVEVVRLASGDCVFEGHGPNHSPVDIGVERKRLDSSDFVDSLRSGRLGAQLHEMTTDGIFEYVWLIVEGWHRIGHNGDVLIPGRRRGEWVRAPGGMSGSEMHKRLLTVELCNGIHVLYTNSKEDTVHFLCDLYRWWTDRAFEDHRSNVTPQHIRSVVTLSDFREVVCRFPGVGVRTSLAVEQAFAGDLRRAVTASVGDWAQIATVDKRGKPRRLGTAVATRIVNFCHGVPA